MAYKVFASPTGTGNVVFEGDVINGYTSPDGKKVRLQFFSNDRGYTAATYLTDQEGAKALLRELKSLLDANKEKKTPFESDSENRNFKLVRELDGAPLILFCIGNDRQQGRTFHRGKAEVLDKVSEEFEKVVGTIDDVKAGKAP